MNEIYEELALQIVMDVGLRSLNEFGEPSDAVSIATIDDE